MNAAAAIAIGSGVALAALGALLARRARDADEFALAGRGLGSAVLAGTLTATWIGTTVLLGAAAPRVGAGAVLLPLGALAGILLLVVLGPMVRAVPAQTLPQILGVRFGRAARDLGGAIVVGTFLVLIAWQVGAGAAIAAHLFPATGSLVLTLAFGGLAILLAILAGMHSVALAGALAGAVILAATLVGAALSWRHWQATGASLPPELTNWTGGRGALFWAGALLPGFLLVVGDANLTQRFLAAEDPRTARLGAAGMLLGVLLVEGALAVIVVIGGALRSAVGASGGGGEGVIEIAQAVLPGWAASLLVGAVLAALLSAASASLLTAACAAAGDFTERLRTPLVQRGAVGLLGVGALALCVFARISFDRAMAAWTFCGASLAPALLMALLRPLAPGSVVVAGMIGGAAAALVWTVPSLRGHLPEAFRGQDALLAAVAANVAFMVIAAILRPLLRRR